MRALLVAMCLLLLAAAALAQSEQKVKMIRSGREAVEDANAVAQGVHKREAAPSADGDAGSVAKGAKPPPTPEPK